MKEYVRRVKVNSRHEAGIPAARSRKRRADTNVCLLDASCLIVNLLFPWIDIPSTLRGITDVIVPYAIYDVDRPRSKNHGWTQRI